MEGGNGSFHTAGDGYNLRKLDLNQPERSLIRVSQEPIERLLSSMSK
jgi:hypothetical protein